MKKISIFVSLLTLFLMASCEKVIPFDVSDINPSIVVQSTPTAGETIEMHLFLSHFFLSTSYNGEAQVVDDATISLSRNGTPVTLVNNEGEGLYTIFCKPQPGDVLDLKVEVPGRAPVTSHTVVPQEPSCEVVECLIDSTYTYSRCQVKLKIHDPQGANFYELSGMYSDYDYFYDPESDRYIDTFAWRKLSLVSEDVVFTDATSLDYILNEGDMSVYGDCLRFADNLIEGQDHIMTVEFSFQRTGEDWQSRLPYLYVSALSKELYNFDKSREMQYNDIIIISEPTQIQCNIEGGMGIFGSRTKKKLTLNPTYTVFNDDYYYYKGEGKK